MTTEHDREPLHLTAIHLDLQARSISFEAAGQPAFRLTYSPHGILYELLATGNATQDAPPGPAGADQAGPGLAAADGHELPAADAGREKGPTITLAGTLASQPKEGRPDHRGKPTAWAMVAAHLEGRDETTLLSTSFHNHTRAIVLGLNKGDPITAKGYLRQAQQAGRAGTLSVITLVQHPGKAERPPR